MEKIKSHNDMKRNRILFDFESIVDLKLSYLKKNLIEKGQLILDDNQLNTFKFDRMYTMENILSGIEIDHEEFYNPKYPVFTGMKLLAETYLNQSNGLVKPKVLCKDEFQQRIIKETIPNISTIVSSRSNVKTINFSRIVLASPEQALEFRDPITVDFMILNFRENFSKQDSTLIDETVLFQICDVNQITIAKAYPEIPDPVG